jgi:hypothetical protein
MRMLPVFNNFWLQIYRKKRILHPPFSYYIHLFTSGTRVGLKSALYAIGTSPLECHELMPPHKLELRSGKHVHSLTVQKVKESYTLNLTGQGCASFHLSVLNSLRTVRYFSLHKVHPIVSPYVESWKLEYVNYVRNYQRTLSPAGCSYC